MKNQMTLFFNLMLFSIFSFCSSNQLIGQEKVNISTGIGIPEFLNVNLRFQQKQTQIGIGFGIIPLKDESLISVFSDVYCHFGGFSELSDKRPWYGRIGLGYVREETVNFIDKIVYLNLRIGRVFNFSKKLGIELDAGPAIQIFHDDIRKTPGSSWDIEFPVIPSLGMALFYRF